MNNNLIGIAIAGIVGGLLFRYHDLIKIEYMKYKTNLLAEKITMIIFKLIKNKNITLDEVILKFENADNSKNLEEFSKSKSRTVKIIEMLMQIYSRSSKKCLIFLNIYRIITIFNHIYGK